jgi:hypothetical protein
MRGLRRAVEQAVGRVLRSRYGLAALLAIVVVGILGSARLVAGPFGGESPAVVGVPREPITTADPRAGEDGLVSPKPPEPPAVSPGAARPLDVARAFAAAWLRHTGVSAAQWREGLLPHSTAALTGQLAEADPAGVPADRITGAPRLIPRGAEFVEVTIPLDAGRLLLRLISPEGRWLVDGVDWERT